MRAVNEHTSWLHVQLVAAEERATAHVELDEDRLTALLGEETTRVLASAREAAAAIRSRAESDAERVLSQASEQATAMRSDAMAEAIRHRERAETAAMAEVEAAKAHGRQLITTRRRSRERVLADLSPPPQCGRAQVEQHRSGRDRLLGVYEVVTTHPRPRRRALRIAAPEAQPVSPPERSLASGFETGPTMPTRPKASASSRPPPRPCPSRHRSRSWSKRSWSKRSWSSRRSRSKRSRWSRSRWSKSWRPKRSPRRRGSRPAIRRSKSRSTSSSLASGRAEPKRWPKPKTCSPKTCPPSLPAILLARSGLTDESAKETSVEDSVGPDVFDERAAALAPLEVSLARKLRRVLADEQNEVLDRLRRAQRQELDDVVGCATEHAARYGRARPGDLAEAARAGAELDRRRSDGRAPDLDDVVTDLAPR